MDEGSYGHLCYVVTWGGGRIEFRRKGKKKYHLLFLILNIGNQRALIPKS